MSFKILIGTSFSYLDFKRRFASWISSSYSPHWADAPTAKVARKTKIHIFMAKYGEKTTVKRWTRSGSFLRVRRPQRSQMQWRAASTASGTGVSRSNLFGQKLEQSRARARALKLQQRRSNWSLFGFCCSTDVEERSSSQFKDKASWRHSNLHKRSRGGGGVEVQVKHI